MMMEKADDMRAGAMAVALRQSEISLGLNFRENESLGHRVDAILAAAQNVRLQRVRMPSRGLYAQRCRLGKEVTS